MNKEKDGDYYLAINEDASNEPPQKNENYFLIRLKISIPMFCDSCATVLLFVGYINIQASIAQMMGSLIVFVTCIESIVFLGK